MLRLITALSILLSMVSSSRAQSRPSSVHTAKAHNAIQMLQTSSAELAKEARRDAEILNLLREASRALDGTQKHNAVAAALEKISKAKQLAAPSRPAVQQAVQIAKDIVSPAEESPTLADLPRLRGEVQRRPIEQMREVVAEEIFELAQLTTRLSDISLNLTKALANAAAASVGRTAE